jgi:3-carboxy-cis,cis-muconate cycloisomerase
MPQKRNPVAAAEAGAAARRAAALVPVLLGAVVAEHERGLGGWQAEWQPLSELLALAGGAAARAREVVEGLEVHPEAMAANLRSHPSVMAEAVLTALLRVATREEATEAVRRASADAADPASFQAALAADPVASRLGPDGIAAALRPASYLGAAEALVDRALADHGRRRRR